jgi:hypothetical protein
MQPAVAVIVKSTPVPEDAKRKHANTQTNKRKAARLMRDVTIEAFAEISPLIK